MTAPVDAAPADAAAVDATPDARARPDAGPALVTSKRGKTKTRKPGTGKRATLDEP